MNGHKFLKVTGILMIIAAVFSIIAIVWGAIVAVFSVLSIVMNLVNGGEFNVTSVLTGVAVPALYIYGAVLNSKADAQYAA